MNLFPVELLVLIFSKMDFKSRLKCKLVCWQWLEIIMSHFKENKVLTIYNCSLDNEEPILNLIRNTLLTYELRIILSNNFECNKIFPLDIWNKVSSVMIYKLHDSMVQFNYLMESWIQTTCKTPLKVIAFYENGIRQIKLSRPIRNFRKQPFFDCYKFLKNDDNTYVCKNDELELGSFMVKFIYKYNIERPVLHNNLNDDFDEDDRYVGNKFRNCFFLKNHRPQYKYRHKIFEILFSNDKYCQLCLKNLREMKIVNYLKIRLLGPISNSYYLDGFYYCFRELKTISLSYNCRNFINEKTSLPNITSLKLDICHILPDSFNFVPIKFPNLRIFKFENISERCYITKDQIEFLLMNLRHVQHIQINCVNLKDVDLTSLFISHGSKLQVNKIK